MSVIGVAPDSPRKSNIPVLDSSSYRAQIYGAALLGPMINKFEPNDDPKVKVIIFFELIDKSWEDDEGNSRPHLLFKEENFAKGEKANLTKIARALGINTNDPDPGEFIGKECLLSIEKKEKKTAPGEFNNKVTGVSPPMSMEGVSTPPLQTERVIFSFYNPDYESFSKLQGWVQKKIKEGPAFKDSELQQLVAANETQPGGSVETGEGQLAHAV